MNPSRLLPLSLLCHQKLKISRESLHALYRAYVSLDTPDHRFKFT